MTSQGVNNEKFGDQLATVRADFDLLIKAWPSGYKPRVKQEFELAMQGWQLLIDRGAAGAKLVATTTFTRDAVAFASGKAIELVGAAALLELIRGVQTSGNIAEPPSKIEQNQVTPVCPRCGSEMVMRKAQQGANAGKPFWGCPKFPGCRGTRPV